MLSKTPRLKFLFTVFLLILIDQILKNAVLAFLSLPVRLNGLASFEIYKNYGIAFGIPVSGGIFYFLVFVFLIFLFSGRFLKFEKLSRTETAGVIFVFAGAAGNLIDRIRWGYILDFISIKGVFVFNLADVFIVAGVMILLRRLLFKNRQIELK